MAINKNFSVKNGIDVGQNATITGSLTAAGLSYPVSDGDPFAAITTDGNGNLSFANVDTVESDVTNQTGSLIPKGTPVYQTGAAGQTLTIAPSDAANASTMPSIGVAESDIANGDTGRIIHSGFIKGVDTSAFSQGDRIYVADGGGYQVGRPTGETHVVQFLGVVTKVHASNGSGVVFGSGQAYSVPNLDDGNIFIGDNTDTPITATLDTSIVPENGNIYFTDQRAVDAIETHPHLTIDGGTLYIDTDSNRIGINDTSPQEALDVNGNIAVAGDITVMGENLYVGGNSGQAKIHLKADNAGSPALELSDTNNDNYWTVVADDADNNFKIHGSTSSQPSGLIDSPNFEIAQGGTLRTNGNRIFADNYHPNADKWTTARTLSLTGDVTGSVSWDGSGNASLTATVADDSHNHTWNNIDGGSVNSWGGLRHSTGSGYIEFGPGNTYHAHIYTDRPNFYFNRQLLVNGSTVWHSSNDGSGSGLDADTLDGQHASAFASNTPGNVSAFAMSSAPSGWLKCNGAAISRTTYSALFASIGTTFGGGNGSTTFNLPDLRGEFIRGWDDGRGADSGRGFGSYQGDAIRNITGMVKTANERNDHLNNGAFYTNGTASSGTGGGSLGRRVSFNVSRVVPTAADNRPRNRALLYCIKY